MSGHRPRDRERQRRNELMKEINEARQDIQDRGGEALLPNMLRGYLGGLFLPDEPGVREFTDRAGKERQVFEEGYQLKSSLYLVVIKKLLENFVIHTQKRLNVKLDIKRH